MKRWTSPWRRDFPGSTSTLRFRFARFSATRALWRRARGTLWANARSLAELVGATWLVFEPRPLFERMFSDAGLLPPRPAIQCESANASLLLLANTDAVAVLPRGFFSLPRAGGILQEIAIAERIPSFTFGMFKRADAPLTPIASGLAKAVTAVARRLARAA
jgi:LysR family transcriptional regulator of abg operon